MVCRAFSVLMLSLLMLDALALSYGVDVEAYGWSYNYHIYIRPDGSIDPSNAPIVTYDNVTYKLTADIIFLTFDGAIIVQRDGIIIDGCGYTLTTTAEREPDGIAVQGRNVTIRNVVFKDFMVGIAIREAADCTVEGNTFLTNEFAVFTTRSFNVTVANNSFIDNDDAIGIIGCSFATVLGNTISNIIWPNVFGGIHYVDSHNGTIAGNIIAYNDVGLFICESDNNMVFGNIVVNNGAGIELDSCFNNTVFENFVTNNRYGVSTASRFRKCYNNRIYHNNVINNSEQTWIPPWYPGFDIWDDGYPSGGNYWSDYRGVDDYSGPYQNESGSDSIGDTPYIIDAGNRDRYPLMRPWRQALTSTITATVNFKPETLNLKGKGRWITCYIELPHGYNPGYINLTTINLCKMGFIDLDAPTEIGDYDGDGIQDLTVKINRTRLANMLSQIIRYGQLTLKIFGELHNSTLIIGSATLTVSYLTGDVNCDGKVDIYDIVTAASSYDSREDEPNWNPNANFAPPWNSIDIFDIVTITYYYGEKYP